MIYEFGYIEGSMENVISPEKSSIQVDNQSSEILLNV